MGLESLSNELWIQSAPVSDSDHVLVTDESVWVLCDRRKCSFSSLCPPFRAFKVSQTEGTINAELQKWLGVFDGRFERFGV